MSRKYLRDSVTGKPYDPVTKKWLDEELDCIAGDLAGHSHPGELPAAEFVLTATIVPPEAVLTPDTVEKLVELPASDSQTDILTQDMFDQ